MVLGDEDPTWERDWMERLRTVSFVVAMVAREHDVMDIAHVVIPTAAWAERSGTYVNFEGRVQKGARLMDPPPHAVDEVEFFENLAKTWRGPYCGWAPPEIPEMVRHLADGHMVPCQPQGAADRSVGAGGAGGGVSRKDERGSRRMRTDESRMMQDERMTEDQARCMRCLVCIHP